MKKIVLTFLLTFSGLVFAESKTTNIETVGNLQSTHDVGCIKFVQAKNIYTPADLFKSAVACANKGKIEDSARLFLFARIYGSYDTARVQDRSAHQGIMVLVQETFGAMGKNADAVEKEINDNLVGKPEEFSEFCGVVKKIGKPNYHPQYMISHGMSAFTGTKGKGLTEKFDGNQAWAVTLSRCG